MSEKENNPIEIIGEVVEEKKVEEKEIEVEKKEENDVVIENIGEVTVGNDDESIGINISEEVVATIASIAASEVKGVASMSGGFVGGLSEMLGKKTKGVKVQVGEKDTVIDINLTVEYGARIPEVAFEIQTRVKKAVENMTGLKVLEVNVHVQGVHAITEKDKEENQENEENAESNEE